MNEPNNSSNYLQELSLANPIRNKSLVPPKSIFALQSLPQFRYSYDQIDLGPSFSWKELKQVHNLHQTLLSQLFANPLFQANSRFNLKANNLRFGSIRALYSQAAVQCILPKKQQQPQNELQFESRFESGNLAFAVKGESQGQYNLLLQKDINTTRCTQWFFFRVKNKKTKGRIKFNVLNLIKSYSSFQNGMKISICSQRNGYTWSRGGQEIKYLKNNIPIGQNKTYFTLSFIFNFQNEDDITYFAHSPPYTFSMLDSYLLKFTNSPQYSSIYKRKTLTQSPCGNYVDMLTITNFKVRKDKKTVFLTARVHPGQTPSSFVCEGIIDFLLSNTEDAKKLRENFVFKIVPMLNPDGVINGNYRCSLSGYDLNRVWHYDNKFNSPEIYYTKRAILDQAKVFLFIDLHAHSKKKGVFMYGCQNRASPFISRHIPYLFWKEIEYFNYYQCNFGMKLGRDGTSRLCVHRLLNLPYSYTMEHSFYSPIKEKHHFTIKHYKQIGQQLCLTLKKYFCSRQQNMNQIFKELQQNKDLIQFGKDEDEGSSNDSELDEPTEFKQVVENQRPFRRKSSTFRCKILDLASDKNVPQKSVSRNTSPHKTAYPSDNFHTFLSRQIPLRFKRESEIETPTVLNLESQPVKQTEIKGEEVYLSTKLFPREKQDSPEKISVSEPFMMKAIARYEFEEMQSLNNLFLPSLTSASYKRYAKKKIYGNHFIQVGAKYLQSQGLLKQEIKSVSKKKQAYKEHILSYL